MSVSFFITRAPANWLLSPEGEGCLSAVARAALLDAPLVPVGAGGRLMVTNPTAEEIAALRMALTMSYTFWEKRCKATSGYGAKVKDPRGRVDAIQFRRDFKRLVDELDDFGGIHYYPAATPP